MTTRPFKITTSTGETASASSLRAALSVVGDRLCNTGRDRQAVSAVVWTEADGDLLGALRDGNGIGWDQVDPALVRGSWELQA